MTAAGAGYWVDLYHEDKRLGAGFLLTRRFVLTAFHCLRSLGELDGGLDVALTDTRRVPGRVCQRAEEADLALVEIDDTELIAMPLPAAQIARPGGCWRSPYRPTPSDVALSGRIDHSTLHTCEAGGSIEALQLTADQHLGDYSGYSGGPVEGADDPRKPAALGILLEQALSRDAGAVRGSNVLFAATIAEAMRRFDHFDVSHLIDVLRPPTGGKRSQSRRTPADEESVPSKISKISAAESLLITLRQWAERQLIDPAQAAELRLRVARKLIDAELGEGSGGGEY